MKYLYILLILTVSSFGADNIVFVNGSATQATAQNIFAKISATDLGSGVYALNTIPSSTPIITPPVTAVTVVSSAFEASHVLKASAGYLASVSIYNSKASSQFILIMNSATVPADGAVTLLYPPIPIAAQTTVMIAFPIPLTASTGISICNSSTGTFTKTIGSADCAFTAQVQ